MTTTAQSEAEVNSKWQSAGQTAKEIFANARMAAGKGAIRQAMIQKLESALRKMSLAEPRLRSKNN